MRVGFIDRFEASFKNKIPTTVGRWDVACPSGAFYDEKKISGSYIHIMQSLFSAGSVTRLGIIDRTRWRTPARRKTSTTVTASISSDPSTSNTIAVFSLSFSFSAIFAWKASTLFDPDGIEMNHARDNSQRRNVRPRRSATSHTRTRHVVGVLNWWRALKGWVRRARARRTRSTRYVVPA